MFNSKRDLMHVQKESVVAELSIICLLLDMQLFFC